MIDDYYLIRSHFAEYVTKCLDERDIRVWYAAYYSETDETTYRRYLKGARLPIIRILIKTADLLECTVNDLLGYERVDIPHHERSYDSGLDTKHVTKYMAEQVYRRMEELGMSVEELANKAGISHYSVKELGNSRSFVNTSTLVELCLALDCIPSELLGY